MLIDANLLLYAVHERAEQHATAADLEPRTVAWAKAFPAGPLGRSPPTAASAFRPTRVQSPSDPLAIS
jgi:hypothetical protein